MLASSNNSTSRAPDSVRPGDVLSLAIEECNRAQRALQRNFEDFRARWFGGPQYPSWSGDTVSVEAGKSTEAKTK